MSITLLVNQGIKEYFPLIVHVYMCVNCLINYLVYYHTLFLK